VSGAAIEASGQCKLGRTMGTEALGLERVEGLGTLAALPIIADRGMSFAGWTSESVPARQLGEMQELLRVRQSPPPIHEHEDGNRTEPNVSRPNGIADKRGDSHEPEDGSNHQTASATEDEPEQGAQDLSAIERIDRQNVEEKKCHIDIKHRVNQRPQIGNSRVPTEQEADPSDAHHDWGECNVDQGAGGDAPKS